MSASGWYIPVILSASLLMSQLGTGSMPVDSRLNRKCTRIFLQVVGLWGERQKQSKTRICWTKMWTENLVLVFNCKNHAVKPMFCWWVGDFHFDWKWNKDKLVSGSWGPVPVGHLTRNLELCLSSYNVRKCCDLNQEHCLSVFALGQIWNISEGKCLCYFWNWHTKMRQTPPPIIKLCKARHTETWAMNQHTYTQASRDRN